MRLSTKIITLCLSVATFLLTTGCEKDQSPIQGKGYGSMQMNLHKKGTRGLIEGNTLNYLRDARKIELTMLYNQRTIRQTLNLYAINDNAAEFGLTTERLELLPGNYKVTSYVIYGENIENDQAEVLQIGEPDQEIIFTIKTDHLSTVLFPIEAVIRGLFSTMLEKDFSNITTQTANRTKTKSSSQALLQSFDYDAVAKVSYNLDFTLDGVSKSIVCDMKAKKDKATGFVHTDTIALQEGTYTLKFYQLYNSRGELLFAEEKSQPFEIKHYTLSKETVKLTIPKSDAIADYINLKKIWEALDGKNWSWSGTNHPIGSNWLFAYEDGSPRPIDQWGNQPGVVLGVNGRVTQINIGAFNPRGIVPDAIGDMTALEALYLGTHSEDGNADPNEGAAYKYDPYALALKGIDIRSNRLAIAKERSAIRRPKTPSRLSYGKRTSSPRFLTPYAAGPGEKSNRISGISEQIGNLSETLSIIYIANGMIKELPQSFKNLTNLTDLEIYNSPFERFPDQISELPMLVSINLSFLPEMMKNPAALNASLDKFFKGPSAGILQLLYMNNNALTSLPASMSNLTNIRLIDISSNKLVTLPSMGTSVAPIQIFLDANKLKSIPTNFCRTDDIELFSAADNQIELFPTLLSNMSTGYVIEEINLSGNRIAGFEPNFEGIRAEQLNLTTNLLKEMPTEFAVNKSEIFFLRLSYNKIDTIKPAAIKNFKQLQALELAGNNLRYMPKEFNTEHLPYFNGIDLNQNRFTIFPGIILNVNSINQIYIAGQSDFRNGRPVRTLTEWPENFEQHFGMRVLDISGNDIRTIRNFPTLLNVLNISDNPNIRVTVPAEIANRIINGSFIFGYDENQDIQGINK